MKLSWNLNKIFWLRDSKMIKEGWNISMRMKLQNWNKDISRESLNSSRNWKKLQAILRYQMLNGCKNSGKRKKSINKLWQILTREITSKCASWKQDMRKRWPILKRSTPKIWSKKRKIWWHRKKENWKALRNRSKNRRKRSADNTNKNSPSCQTTSIPNSTKWSDSTKIGSASYRKHYKLKRKVTIQPEANTMNYKTH